MGHVPGGSSQRPCVRTPNFTPDGPARPGKTQLRTAVSEFLLARRKPRGSNPLTSTPPLMTSRNAGHRHIRGRSQRPHNGWRPPHCASSAAWTIPPHPAHCFARSSGTSARRTAQSARWATTWRAPGWPTPSWRAAASAWSRRPRPTWRTSWPTSCAAAAPARTPWHAGAAPPGRTGLRPGPATRPAHLPTGRRYAGRPRLRQGHHQDLVVPARYP
jgi:hypothetical protein